MTELSKGFELARKGPLPKSGRNKIGGAKKVRAEMVAPKKRAPLNLWGIIPKGVIWHFKKGNVNFQKKKLMTCIIM